MSNSCKIIVGLRTRPKKNCNGVVQSESSRKRVIVKVPKLEDFEKVRRNLNRGDQVIQRIIGSDQKKLNVYTYDKVYGPESTQTEIYSDLGVVILENCLKGYNSCLFAYGQTGSGKTHTMMGPGTDCEDEMKGIIPRLCSDLFDRTRECEISEGEDVDYRIEVSMIEIYNEKVKDLFTNKNNLEVREKGKNNFVIPSLSCQVVQSTNEIQNWLEIGGSNRTIAKTLMNDTSSRAHTIFQIHLTRTEQVNEEQGKISLVTRSVVNLIDLAGSEQMNTAIVGNESKIENIEQRKKELIEINKSLSALGRCIKMLHEKFSNEGKPKPNTKNRKKKKYHIPYRDSTLTKLIANSLGGNAKTIMIATLSPDPYHYEQTISTCRFADRVKNIKNKPVINIDPKERIIKELRERIKNLESEIEQNHNTSVIISQRQQEEVVEEEEECEGEEECKDNNPNLNTTQPDNNHNNLLQSPKSKKYTELKEKYQEVVAENEEMKSQNKEILVQRNELKEEREALIEKIRKINESKNKEIDEIGNHIADLTHQKDSDIVEVKAQKGVLEKRLEISKKLLKKQIIERRRMESEKQKLMTKMEDNQVLLNQQIDQFRILETRQHKLHEKNTEVLKEKERVELALDEAQEKLDEHVSNLEHLQRYKNVLEKEKSDLEERTREEENRAKKMKEELGLIEQSMKLLQLELEQRTGEYLQKESEAENRYDEVVSQIREMGEEKEALQFTLQQSNDEISLQARRLETNHDARLALETERSELLGRLDEMRQSVDTKEKERCEVESELQKLLNQNKNLSKTLKANEKRIQAHQIQIQSMERELDAERCRFMEKTRELEESKHGKIEAEKRIRYLEKQEKVISEELVSEKETNAKVLHLKNTKLDDKEQKYKNLYAKHLDVLKELKTLRFSSNKLTISLDKKNNDLGRKKIRLDSMDKRISEMKSTVHTHKSDYAGQMNKMKREKAQLWAQKSFLEKKLELSRKIIFKQRKKISDLDRQYKIEQDNLRKKLQREKQRFQAEVKREREHWQKMKQKKDEVLRKARNMLNQHHQKFQNYKRNQQLRIRRKQLQQCLPRSNIRHKLHRKKLNSSFAQNSPPGVERRRNFKHTTTNNTMQTTEKENNNNIALKTPKQQRRKNLGDFSSRRKKKKEENLVMKKNENNSRNSIPNRKKRSNSTPLTSPTLLRTNSMSNQKKLSNDKNRIQQQQNQNSQKENVSVRRREENNSNNRNKKVNQRRNSLPPKNKMTLQERRNKQKEEKDNTKHLMWYEQVTKFMKNLM